MSRGTCPRCLTTYDGLACPVCAVNDKAEEVARRATRDQEEATAAMREAMEEQTAQITEAAEQAAFESQMAMERATEERRRITANAWKLESQAKSEQARALIESGLIDEALALALQAMKQDPGNFDAVTVASVSFKRKGRTEEAHALDEKLIQMLSLPAFKARPEMFLSALHSIGHDSSLVQTLSSVIEKCLGGWVSRDSEGHLSSLASELTSSGQFRTAMKVQSRMVENFRLSLYSISSTLNLIRAMQGADRNGNEWRVEARSLASWLEGGAFHSRGGGRESSLLSAAFAQDIYAVLGVEGHPVAEFLAKIDASACPSIEEDLKTIRELSTQGTFCQGTVSTVLERLRAKYSNWESVVQDKLYTGVEQQVNSLPPRSHGCLVGFLAFCIFTVSSSFFFILFARLDPARSGGEPIVAFGSLIGAILLGVSTKVVSNGFRRYRLTKTYLSNALNQRNAQLEALGLPRIKSPRLKVGPPIASLQFFLILIGVFLVVWISIIGWFVKTTRATMHTTNSEGSPASAANSRPGQANAAVRPQIAVVSYIQPKGTQAITIVGSGFGTRSPYSGDSNSIEVTDQSRNWNAGSSRDFPADQITLSVALWTDTKIEISGFAGAYGSGSYSLNPGDRVTIRIWNAQTGQGPATNHSIVVSPESLEYPPGMEAPH